MGAPCYKLEGNMGDDSDFLVFRDVRYVELEHASRIGEAAEEEVMMAVHKHIRCDLGVPSCRDAFTPSTRLVSIRRGRGWFLFRF